MTVVAHGPGFVVCSFTDCIGTGEINGRSYYWDFSDRFGPLFTNSKGHDLKVQPGIKSNAWKAFEAWHKELLAERDGPIASQKVAT